MDRAILRNAASLLLVQAANFLLPLVTFPYLTRVLGPQGFGTMAFCTAATTYLVLFTDYGFNLSATKRVAELRSDKVAMSRFACSVLAAKAMLCSVSAVVLCVVVFLVPRFWAFHWILLATFPMVVGSVLFPQWLFQGLERMGFVSVCFIGARACLVPFTFLFVHAQGDIWKAALISSSTTVLAGLVSLGLAQRYRLIDLHLPDRSSIVLAYRDGWHVFISTAAVSLYSNTNSVLLGLIAGNTQVGYFAAADRLRMACSGVVSVMSNAVYPRINAILAKDRQAAFALIRKLLLVQGGATLFVSLTLIIGAPLIVRTVMGPSFSAAVDVVRCIAFVPFLVGLSNVFGIQTMLSLGMKRQFSRILLISGALNVMVLVPLAHLLGAVGAATALLVTEALVTLVMALTLYKHRIPIFNIAKAFA